MILCWFQNAAFHQIRPLMQKSFFRLKGCTISRVSKKRATFKVERVYYIFIYITCIHVYVYVCDVLIPTYCHVVLSSTSSLPLCMTGFLQLSPLLWGSWRGALQPDLRSLSQKRCWAQPWRMFGDWFFLFCGFDLFLFVSWWVLGIISHWHDPWTSFRWNMFHHFESWTLSDDTSFN